MLEIIKFVLSDFWVWLGFIIAFNIPLLYLMECISNIIVKNVEMKAAYKYMLECKKEGKDV